MGGKAEGQWRPTTPAGPWVGHARNTMLLGGLGVIGYRPHVFRCRGPQAQARAKAKSHLKTPSLVAMAQAQAQAPKWRVVCSGYPYSSVATEPNLFGASRS